MGEPAERRPLGVCVRGLMKGRWCIPIHDLRGDLVAYAGRWAGPDQALPEGRGAVQAAAAVPKDPRAVQRPSGRPALGWPRDRGRGLLGALRLHTLGVPAVALMGSSISAEQLALLRAWPVVTLLMDGDEPGREAAAQLLPVLAERHHVHLAVLPDGLGARHRARGRAPAPPRPPVFQHQLPTPALPGPRGRFGSPKGESRWGGRR